MTNTVSPTSQTQYRIYSISHLQALAEHWDLLNTEIFQSKDGASRITTVYLRSFPHILHTVNFWNSSLYKWSDWQYRYCTVKYMVDQLLVPYINLNTKFGEILIEFHRNVVWINAGSCQQKLLVLLDLKEPVSRDFTKTGFTSWVAVNRSVCRKTLIDFLDL
jgi:hypothetical protein